MPIRKSAPKLVACDPSHKKVLPHVIGMTDPQRASDPWDVLAKLPPQSALIWRLFGPLPARKDWLALSRAAHRRKILLLLSWQGGALPGAKLGLHLPERSLGRSGAAARRAAWSTAAVHSAAALHAAAKAGANAVLISPVFQTESHQGARPLGVIRFAQLVHQARALGLAAYALGGIDAKSRKRLRALPLAGVAGISFLSSKRRQA